MILEGITILDLTRQLPGPFCTQMLADFGARVIKIEDPAGGDPVRIRGNKVRKESGIFMTLNRNKKSVTLDLKQDKGREAFLRLAKSSDVVVEGFRPGVVTRLGIDYNSVKAVNDRIIYAAISGYGQEGSHRTRPGHDINYIGIGGLLSITGLQGGPPVIPGGQVADIYSSLNTVVGILLALYGREKTGKGCYIDISMLDCVMASLPVILGEYMATKKNPERSTMVLNGGYACYNVYETKDNKYMSLGALEPHFWEGFCRKIGREDLIADHYAPPGRQKDVIRELQRLFRKKTRAEWVDTWRESDVPCEPILAFEEALSHPPVLERRTVETADHPTEGHIQYFRNPVQFEGALRESNTLPPFLGEHTDEVLLSAGFTGEELQILHAEKVI